MEQKLDLSDIDCRKYYQLVQEKISPANILELDQTATLFTTNQGNVDVEDLGLKLKNPPENQNETVFTRRAKLRYFEKESDDEEDALENDNDGNPVLNGDGHCIVDDDAWSDYWDSGVDDLDNAAISTSRMHPIATKVLATHQLPQKRAQIVTAMVNGIIVEEAVKVGEKVSIFMINFRNDGNFLQIFNISARAKYSCF